MSDFIGTLAFCSIAMSVIALIYLMIFPLLSKKISPKGLYYSWLVIVIGFIIPFRPQINLDVPLPVALLSEAGQTDTGLTSPIPFLSQNILQASENAAAVQAPASRQVFPAILLLLCIWFAGVAFILARHLLRHYRFIKMMRRWNEDVPPGLWNDFQTIKEKMGISGRIGIQKCACITTPMMIGFENAVILLPAVHIPEDELLLILKHELVHYKRKDMMYKALLLLATAIHWFNPVVYLVRKAVTLQCEISCDAEITRDTDTNLRMQYGEAILGSIQNQTRVKTALSTHFLGSKKDMKKRIFSIMDKTKKRTGLAIVCAAFIFTMAIGITFTDVSAIPQNESVEEAYYAVSDGIKLTISELHRENDQLMMYWKLEDTTGNRLRLSEDEQLCVWMMLKDENNTADDALMIAAHGLGNSDDTYNKEEESVSTWVFSSVDSTKDGATGTFSIERILVGNIYEGPIILQDGSISESTVYFQDRELSFEGNWTIQIQIPEDSWFLTYKFTIDDYVNICGIDISDATLGISPNGGIYIDGSTIITDQFRIRKQDSIEIIFKDGKKEGLTVFDYEIEPIDIEEIEYAKQNFDYFTGPKEGDTHGVCLFLKRELSDDPLSLDQVKSIEKLSINGVIFPLKNITSR